MSAPVDWTRVDAIVEAHGLVREAGGPRGVIVVAPHVRVGRAIGDMRAEVALVRDELARAGIALDVWWS